MQAKTHSTWQKEQSTKQVREDWAYHHPVHALLSRNINGLKHPETYQSQVDEKPSPPATCIEICSDMGIQIIAPSPGAEPTFILDYGPQFCGFEMVP